MNWGRGIGGGREGMRGARERGRGEEGGRALWVGGLERGAVGVGLEVGELVL